MKLHVCLHITYVIRMSSDNTQPTILYDHETLSKSRIITYVRSVRMLHVCIVYHATSNKSVILGGIRYMLLMRGMTLYNCSHHLER